MPKKSSVICQHCGKTFANLGLHQRTNADCWLTVEKRRHEVDLGLFLVLNYEDHSRKAMVDVCHRYVDPIPARNIHGAHIGNYIPKWLVYLVHAYGCRYDGSSPLEERVPDRFYDGSLLANEVRRAKKDTARRNALTFTFDVHRKEIGLHWGAITAKAVLHKPYSFNIRRSDDEQDSTS